MAKTVGQVFGMDGIAVYKAKASTLQIKIPDTNIITSDQLIGIEVEVENAQLTGSIDPAWSSHADGSLRNGGIEFVTRSAIQASEAPYLLDNLLNTALSKESCFSPRTSVHVHFNMVPYSVDVVKNITMLYAIFEPLFFRFTGRGRMKNIYCVPLIDSTLLANFERAQLRDKAAAWTKYTSLNLLPLTQLGTIEARHMHGTFDVKKLCVWIRIWCRLIEYCLKNDVSSVRKLIAGLTPDSDFPTLLKQIFGDDCQYLKFRESSDLKESVMTVKQCFVDPITTSMIVAERDLKNAPYFLFKAK